MLVSCPGCGEQVSDRALSCPFCGRSAAPPPGAPAPPHRALLLRRRKRYPEAVATLDLELFEEALSAFDGATGHVLLAAQPRRARERLVELQGGARR